MIIVEAGKSYIWVHQMIFSTFWVFENFHNKIIWRLVQKLVCRNCSVNGELIVTIVAFFFLRGWGRGRRWGRERNLSRLHTQHRDQCAAWFHNSEIMTWAKVKSQVVNWLNYSGAPIVAFYWATTAWQFLSQLLYYIH